MQNEKTLPYYEAYSGGRSSVVEHHVANVMVEGSNPFTRSIFFLLVDSSGRSSVVEHHVANVMVEGSNPFTRSIFLLFSVFL